MCIAQGHIAVMPVRLEPAASRSQVKHSTTEPLPPLTRIYKRKLRPVPPSLHTTNKCRSITGSELQVKAEHARIHRGDRESRGNHNFDRFLQKLAFGRPHPPGKSWTPPPPRKMLDPLWNLGKLLFFKK